MAYLTVAGATKTFGSFFALNDVSLAVERGEFFTLLGPSGCGKTTLLRSIAGFNDLTSGSISLDSADLLKVPPHKRDIGMVFQDYAIFPHLSVAENVAFGLKPRKVPREEARRRVEAALAAVRLSALADRMPAAMSGGQQQRIGLARAMVINPRLLLMDEPLSNLDAKLRIELREEIRDIQKQVGIATIYVTHDQEEALAISDRICVMNSGRVEQIGTPEDIYGDPRTRFVASFVGTINLLAAGSSLDDLLCRLELSAIAQAHPEATWAVRPESLSFSDAGPGLTHSEPTAEIDGKVLKYTYLGREAQLHLDTPVGPLVVQVSAPSRSLARAAGSAARLRITRRSLFGFDADGRRIDRAG